MGNSTKQYQWQDCDGDKGSFTESTDGDVAIIGAADCGVYVNRTQARALAAALLKWAGPEEEGFRVKATPTLKLGQTYVAKSVTVDGQYVCLVPVPQTIEGEVVPPPES